MKIIPGMVSVIIASYDKAHLLDLAIRTVLWQTYTNFEIIVVDDCSPRMSKDLRKKPVGRRAINRRKKSRIKRKERYVDNMMQKYAKHPRIRYYRLDQNFGEQSGPNNYGVSMAQGEYIAFLNHDDLWFPDHLEQGIRTLKSQQADMVYSRMLAPTLEGGQTITGMDRDGRFYPKYHVPASSWIVTHQTMKDVGPWRPAYHLYCMSSQDWLMRAWWAGRDVNFGLAWMLGAYKKTAKKMVATQVVSSMHIPSAMHLNTYITKESAEQDLYFGLMSQDYLALRNSIDTTPPPSPPRDWVEILTKRRTLRSLLRTCFFIYLRIIQAVFCRYSPLIGIHPDSIKRIFVFGFKKAGFQNWLNRARGLKPLKPPAPLSHQADRGDFS